MMYRGDEIVNENLIKHFGIKDEIYWDLEIIRNLGADFFSGGASLNEYYTYIPKYVGPEFDCEHDKLYFFVFGINSKAVYDDEGRFFEFDFFHNPPLANATSVADIKKHRFPQPEWFDFNWYTTMITRKSASGDAKDATEYISYKDIKPLEDHFSCTYFFNTIYIISSYIRTMDRLLLDMAMDSQFAHTLIDRVGEICVELNRLNLEKIGDRIEIFGMWDDFATQTDMFMSPDMWREYFKPYYKRIIEDAKKFDLIVYFHCCGNLYDVIPDLIEIGVDILDPIQTSARRMNFNDLKRDFGKDLCFHGGVDMQQLLSKGTPEQIKEEVSKIKDLFACQGGLLLGPSHVLTRDIPVRNVVAMYQ
jgi:uroporphyrinogen decarboxylase